MKQSLRIRHALAGVVLLCPLYLQAADLVWIGGTGNWNAAGNWSPAQIPTAADNTWITNNGTYTVTVPAGATATNNSLILGGASGTQTLAVDRATLSLNGASVINPNGQLSWLVSQSLVAGPGNLTVNGALNWSVGTMSGAGVTTIGSSGVLILGSGGLTLGRTLNNGGTASWSGGNLTISAGNSLNNLAGAIFDITADGRLSGLSTTPINNSGLFRLLNGVTGTTITAPLNNAGTLQVLASVLNLNLGGTHSGVMSNALGATLNFGGGNHVLNAGALVTGPGVLGMSGASTLTANGDFAPGTTLSVSSGVATLSAGCDVSGTSINIGGSGAVLNFNSAGPVAALQLVSGTLGGSSPILSTGPLTLAGGTVTNGLLTAAGGLTLSGNTTLNGAKLVNPATAIWSAGNLTGANGAVVSNLLGATFINTFDGNAATGAGATPSFINAGSFQKTNGTAAAGTTSIDFQFINTGTVEVRTNTLRYAVNQQTAGVTLLDGGNLAAQAQPLQFLGGTLVGTGLVTVANTLNLVNASALSPGLPIGELDISGNYQQTSAGVLNIDLSGYVPGTGFGLVTVTAGGAGGVATLSGTLNVALLKGFSPTNGATFTFLTANSRVGSFAAFNYPSDDIGMQLSYDSTSAKVTVSNLKPVVANPIPNPPPLTYGQSFNFQFAANTFSDPDGDTLTYAASGLPAGISFSGATQTFSGTATQAGVFLVTVSAKDSGTPSLTATNSFVLTVNPAQLGIAAQPQTKTYGAVDPALTYSVTGLQLGDTPVDVLTGSLTRAAGENVAGGPYAITQGTLTANSNYVVSFSGNSLAITPAPLVVTADDKAKVYGTVDPTFSASFFGFVNGETMAVLGGTLSLVRSPGEGVGRYPITPSGLTSDNYAITFNSGTLSISKAPLTVTADNKTKLYGQADPTFTATYTGFVNGDTPATLGGALNFARAGGENVGTYSLTPSGLTSSNYSLTFTSGILTITKATLAIAADNKTKTYGATDPNFTATYSGFVNGDTAAVLTGTLSFSRWAGEAVGNYLITPSGLTSSNYTLTFNTGTLAITPAPLSVTAEPKTKIYGTADPAFTVAYGGFVNGDNPGALGGTLAFARAAGENVGNYPVIPSGLTSSNYSITFNAGTLTITQAGLSVRADNQNKLYGTADPPFTVSYQGLANGDTPAALGGSLSVTRSPGENVGTYALTPSGLTSSNYTITFQSGSLAILQAPLSVTADNKSKVYGTLDPAFTASFSGFVNGESSNVLSGTLVFSRVTGEGIGSYAITPGGLTSSNYALAFHNGTLRIVAPAPVIRSLTRVGAGTVDLTWTAVSNATYRVQSIADLASTNWTDLAGDVLATGDTASKTDVLSTTNRFYRIEVLP